MHRRNLVIIVLSHVLLPPGAALLIVPAVAAQSLERPLSEPAYGRARQIAKLANQDITESSGIAPSRCRSDLFWTHNDSGDVARLFAFDRQGKSLGLCRLNGVTPNDCEDIASYARNGRNWLMLADVGDNGLRRKTYQLYVCEEPSTEQTQVTVESIEFRYEKGVHNCESVAVDPILGVVLFTTKVFGPECHVFQLPLPTEPRTEVQVAKRIATIPVTLAVAMDISPDGLRAIVLTYGDAFEFARQANETWDQAFAKPARRLVMPVRRQGESICYGHDGRSLYLTSEFKPTPLFEVPWMIAPLADQPESSDRAPGPATVKDN